VISHEAVLLGWGRGGSLRYQRVDVLG